MRSLIDLAHRESPCECSTEPLGFIRREDIVEVLMETGSTEKAQGATSPPLRYVDFYIYSAASWE